MDGSKLRVLTGIIVVSAAVTVFALLGASVTRMLLSCTPPWAPSEMLRSLAYWGGLGGGFGVVCVVVLLAMWRMQHTFIHTLWTRRVLGSAILLAAIAGSVSVLFNQPIVRHVCT